MPKTIKNLDRIISKSTIKPEINAILVTDKHIVATDSYKLVEIVHDFPNKEPNSAYMVKLQKGVKKISDVAIYTNADSKKTATVLGGEASYPSEIVDGEYPEYKHLFPTNKPTVTVRLMASHLRELADFFDKNNQMIIDVEIRTDLKHQPLVFTAQGIRALLMPCN